MPRGLLPRHPRGCLGFGRQVAGIAGPFPSRGLQPADRHVLDRSGQRHALRAETDNRPRPDLRAAPPEQAEPLYEKFVEELGMQLSHVARGRFGSRMIVRSVADGPVNIIAEFSAAPVGSRQ